MPGVLYPRLTFAGEGVPDGERGSILSDGKEPHAVRLCFPALLLCLLLSIPPMTHAQIPTPTLRDLAETDGYSLGHPHAITPTPNGEAVLFLRSGPRDRTSSLYEWTAKTQQARVLLSADTLLEGKKETLSAAERARRERQRQVGHGITSFSLSENGKVLLVPLGGKLSVVTRKTGEIIPLQGVNWLDARLSPDALSVAATDGNEMFVCAATGGPWRQLTRGHTNTLTHGTSEFVAQEEMGRSEGFWWSPDSQFVAYQETDTSPVQTLYIPDPAHPQVPPAAFPYPRAGTPNARVRLGVVAAKGGPTRWVNWDSAKFSYLARVVWKEAAAPLTLVVLTRTQKEVRVLAATFLVGGNAEAAGGTSLAPPLLGAGGAIPTHTLVTEGDPAWINLDPDTQMPRWLPDGSGFLWRTEKFGDTQLTLHNADGSLRHALTSPGFHYSAVADVDPNRGVVVMGGADSRQSQAMRVSLNGEYTKPLTAGQGLHAVTFSDRHTLYVDSFWGLDGACQFRVYDSERTLLGSLPSAAETPPALPRLELTEATAGDRTLDAAIVRPHLFDPAKKYPVILSVYAGPGVKVVQASPRYYFSEQWMADQGYIVVSLDGRGTPGNGRLWEQAVAGNLIDIALQDQCDGLTALAHRYPEMDTSRVGVMGWSFGGYFSAMATLRRPDVFACGIAGAPITDWRDYDTCYTERYMGLPSENKRGYDRASVLTYAKDLTRPLLIIHGVTDDNVYFVNSLRLCEALFAAGKPFEFLPMTGTHLAGAESADANIALMTRQLDFLNAHLHPSS